MKMPAEKQYPHIPLADSDNNSSNCNTSRKKNNINKQ